MADPLEARMFELMEGEVADRERQRAELDRQREFFHNQQRGSAFPQYGGGYGMGYGGGRGSYASAQKLMMSHELAVQRMLLEQQINQQKVADEATATKEEMERRLAIANKELVAYVNNPMLDKNDWEYKNAVARLKDDIYEIETGLERHTPQVHEKDSGFTRTVTDPVTGDKKEEPIMSTFIIGPDGKPIFYSEGKDVAAHNLAKAKQEALNMHNARTSNINEGLLEVARQNAKTARQKEDNARESNRIKESGAGKKEDDIYKEKIGIRDKMMTERGAERKEWLSRKMVEWKNNNPKADLNKMAVAKEKFTSESYDKFPSNVSAGEVNERYENRQLLRKPTISTEEEKKSVQYEQPEDAMYPEEDPLGMGASDEQFAGTEPAGLYDPTGQPLQMEGGMYSGFA